MMVAEVVVDITHEKLDKSFSYLVPPSLEAGAAPGMAVRIPFGKGNREIKGYILSVSDKTDVEPGKLKSILSLENTEESVDSRLIALASYIKEHYGGTMVQAMKTVFPVREKVKDKEARTLRLTDEERAREYLEVARKKHYAARERLLCALLEAEGFCLDAAKARQAGAASDDAVSFLEKEGILKKESRRAYREAWPGTAGGGKRTPPSEDHALTPEQAKALSEIQEEWEGGAGRPVLLHGVTGSGKTHLYMELIRRTVEQGRQVIVLIPEISLTYQTVTRFEARFGEQVSVVNSRLSAGARYDQFCRARKGEISIMVGPRSCLFTPFSNLGLIIIDEEHEPAYKGDMTPRYHARETAIARAGMEGARVLLGSATPSLEAYRRALMGTYRLVRLAGRYEGRSLAQVSVTDLRAELMAGNRSLFGRELKRELSSCLSSGHQAMLFLNRRGYASFMTCRSCGYVAKCRHCDVSLSFHMNGRLICHYCGYQEDSPQSCPSCHSPYFGGMRAGTEQVEAAVKKILPSARVMRMDFDTTRKKGSYEEILSAFSRHEADILVGTQMIVKGHDFPDVTLVGVLAADLSLSESDFRCAERTFQLLTQAVGRSGRGAEGGKAIIQTYHPEHYAITCASSQDYEAFYREEMSYRELMDYPPAAAMLVILGSSRDEEKLKAAMHYLALFIRRICPADKASLIGPAPLPVGKIKDAYRQSIRVRTRKEEALLRIRELAERYIALNMGFQDIFIQFDME